MINEYSSSPKYHDHIVPRSAVIYMFKRVWCIWHQGRCSWSTLVIRECFSLSSLKYYGNIRFPWISVTVLPTLPLWKQRWMLAQMNLLRSVKCLCRNFTPAKITLSWYFFCFVLYSDAPCCYEHVFILTSDSSFLHSSYLALSPGGGRKTRTCW